MIKFKLPMLLAFLLALFVTPVVAEPPKIDADSVAWVYPDASYSGSQFAQAFRYRTLVGGRHLPSQSGDVYFGEAEWAPGAIYVGHRHPAPEIYYVISGTAEWTVDGETFIATAGTAIYTKPNAVHRMVNVGDGILKTVWMWWGKPEVLYEYPEIVEPIENQPERAKFPG